MDSLLSRSLPYLLLKSSPLKKKLPFRVGVRGISLRTEQTVIEKISYVQAETYHNLSPLKLRSFAQQQGIAVLVTVP